MNEFYPQQLMPQQQYGELAPQGFFGGLLGAPLGGLIGRGIGGLFGNANLGRQIGQAAGGIGGGLLPFGADPMSAAYAQQQQQLQQQQLQQQQLQQQLLQQAQLAQLGQAGQLAPQGWFGNIIKSVARPLGGAIGGAFGNAGIGNTIGGIAGHLGGMLPFGADPVAAAYAQQGLAPQSLFGDLLRKAHPYSSVYNPFIPQPPNLLPFGADMQPLGMDPLTAAYAQQQAQLAQLAQLAAQQGQPTMH